MNTAIEIIACVIFWNSIAGIYFNVMHLKYRKEENKRNKETNENIRSNIREYKNEIARQNFRLDNVNAEIKKIKEKLNEKI